MLDIFCLFIPSMICIMWATLLNMRQRTTSMRLINVLAILFSIYFFFDAHFYYKNIDSYYLTRLDWPCSLLVMGAPPVILLYLQSYVSERLNWKLLGLLLPGLIYNGLMLYYYIHIGFDNISEFLYYYYSPHLTANVTPELEQFHYWWHNVYTLLFFVEAGGLMIYCIWYQTRFNFSFGKMFRFFFRGGTSQIPIMSATLIMVLIVILGARLGIGASYMRLHPVVCSLFSITIGMLMFLILYLGYVGDRQEPTLRSLLSLDLMSEQAAATVQHVRDVNINVAEDSHSQDMFLVNDARELAELKRQLEELEKETM